MVPGPEPHWPVKIMILYDKKYFCFQKANRKANIFPGWQLLAPLSKTCQAWRGKSEARLDPERFCRYPYSRITFWPGFHFWPKGSRT
jgi:hypothetical protein